MKSFLKKWGKKWLLSFFVTLPLTFVLFFFWLLPFRYDIVVHIDNVVGEGSCSSFLSDSNKSFSYLYQGGVYIGPELKTLRLTNLQYNAEYVELYMYDIQSYDILSYDVAMFGLTVTHRAGEITTHPFTISQRAAVDSDEPVWVHLELEEGAGSIPLAILGNGHIPTGVRIFYAVLILLVAMLLAAGLTKLLERFPAVRMPLLSASALLATMLLGCLICESLPYADSVYFLLNWMLFFAAALVINSLTLPWLGTSIVSLFAIGWYTANYYVIQFRSKPVMPADLKALGTAKEVVGGYDLTPSWQIVVGVLVVILYVVLLILCWRKSRPQEKPALKTRLIRRGAGILAAVLLVVLAVNNSYYDNLNTFQWDAMILGSFHREGILLTYIRSAISAHVDKPEGYSRELVDSFLADYQPETDNGAVHPTRIIMIMDEAFSDLRSVGLDPQIDVMPFIDSLDANTIEGSLYVSVIAGGTCNTEFEALTGNTLAFLGSGAYPYTENVTEPLFSLASYFRDNGYLTEAFHGGHAQNWNRDVVYPNLGFGEFHSLETYPEVTADQVYHGYIADAVDFSLIAQRDAENSGDPRFLFNVTIQNHAPYDHFDDIPRAETLIPFQDSLHQEVQVYLSLLSLSNDALRDLMEQLQASDEPTMVVFFGDHQPYLSDAAQDQVYTQVDELLDYYQSKFFIWTNYETETVHQAAISANYLPWLILERGNFPLPPYVQLLRELHEKYPIITSQGVVSADGYSYDDLSELLQDPLVRKYQYVQYANLFDELDPAWFQVQTK